MALVFTLLAAASLAGCLAAPSLYFYGRISEEGYKLGFLLFSAGWFVFATVAENLRERSAGGR
jgi:hypothetical protein